MGTQWGPNGTQCGPNGTLSKIFRKEVQTLAAAGAVLASIIGFLSMNISFRVRILSSRFSMVTLLAPPEVIALVNSETSWSNLFQQTHRVSALACVSARLCLIWL